MRKSVLCFLVILVAAAVPSSAADNGFYLGISAGKSSLDYQDYDPSVGDDYVDGSTWGLKAFAGYRFLKFLAVEGGYVNFGHPEWIQRNSQGYRLKIDAAVNGWDAMVVGILPVGGVEFFAKAGVIAWDSSFKIIRDEDVDEDTASGTDAAYGLGFAVNAGKGASLRFEAERFDIDAWNSVNLYTVGVLYTF